MESPFDLRGLIQALLSNARRSSQERLERRRLDKGTDALRILLGCPELGSGLAPFSPCAARTVLNRISRLNKQDCNQPCWVPIELGELGSYLPGIADRIRDPVDRDRVVCADLVLQGHFRDAEKHATDLVRRMQDMERARREGMGLDPLEPVFYFGGSFDPPTTAHAGIIRDLCRFGSVMVGVLQDRQKEGSFSEPVGVRVQLVNEMLKAMPETAGKVLVGTQVSPIVDMLVSSTYRQRPGGLPVFPDYLAIGTDCKDDLIAGRWKCGRTVLDCCDLHVIRRPAGSVSSTQVRKILAEDQDGLDRCVREDLLTKAVADCLEHFSSK